MFRAGQTGMPPTGFQVPLLTHRDTPGETTTYWVMTTMCFQVYSVRTEFEY